jgi:hypothetical protein
VWAGRHRAGRARRRSAAAAARGARGGRAARRTAAHRVAPGRPLPGLGDSGAVPGATGAAAWPRGAGGGAEKARGGRESGGARMQHQRQGKMGSKVAIECPPGGFGPQTKRAGGAGAPPRSPCVPRAVCQCDRRPGLLHAPGSAAHPHTATAVLRRGRPPRAARPAPAPRPPSAGAAAPAMGVACTTSRARGERAATKGPPRAAHARCAPAGPSAASTAVRPPARAAPRRRQWGAPHSARRIICAARNRFVPLPPVKKSLPTRAPYRGTPTRAPATPLDRAAARLNLSEANFSTRSGAERGPARRSPPRTRAPYLLPRPAPRRHVHPRQGAPEGATPV